MNNPYKITPIERVAIAQGYLMALHDLMNQDPLPTLTVTQSMLDSLDGIMDDLGQVLMALRGFMGIDEKGENHG